MGGSGQEALEEGEWWDSLILLLTYRHLTALPTNAMHPEHDVGEIPNGEASTVTGLPGQRLFPTRTREEQVSRAEIETLRRAVLALQSERLEPPPEYRSEMN